MRISLDNEFALHGASLSVLNQRAEILSGNLANIETPGYLARDIDYQSIMQSVSQSLEQTNSGNPTASTTPAMFTDNDLMYRIPYQTTQDGNTAELGPEQTRFDQNAMAFQTSLRFMNLTISGLKEAIAGGE